MGCMHRLLLEIETYHKNKKIEVVVNYTAQSSRQHTYQIIHSKMLEKFVFQKICEIMKL